MELSEAWTERSVAWWGPRDEEERSQHRNGECREPQKCTEGPGLHDRLDAGEGSKDSGTTIYSDVQLAEGGTRYNWIKP